MQPLMKTPENYDRALTRSADAVAGRRAAGARGIDGADFLNETLGLDFDAVAAGLLVDELTLHDGDALDQLAHPLEEHRDEAEEDEPLGRPDQQAAGIRGDLAGAEG